MRYDSGMPWASESSRTRSAGPDAPRSGQLDDGQAGVFRLRADPHHGPLPDCDRPSNVGRRLILAPDRLASPSEPPG